MYAKRRRTNSGGVKGTFASPAYVRSINRKYSAPRAAARVTPTFVTSRRYARIRRISDSEKKYIEISKAPYALGNNAAAADLVTDISVIPTGTGVTQRIGKTVRITGVQIRAHYRQTLAATAVGTNVQFALVWDREPDQSAAVPLITDIFMTAVTPTLSNRDNAPRFKVLKKWLWETPPFTATTTASGDHVFTIMETINLKKMDAKISFTAGSTVGTWSEKVKGGLLWCSYADGTAAVTSATSVGTGEFFRVDFDDK